MKRISIVKIQQVKDGTIPYETKTVSSPASVVKLIQEYLKGVDREHFGVIGLNSKNEINHIHTISIGTVDETCAYPRDIFKTAILSNCVSIIVFHNHPSGHPAPSHHDRKLTSKIIECGELLQIKVIDHVVVGDDKKYYSFKEEGLI